MNVSNPATGLGVAPVFAPVADGAVFALVWGLWIISPEWGN